MPLHFDNIVGGECHFLVGKSVSWVKMRLTSDGDISYCSYVVVTPLQIEGISWDVLVCCVVQYSVKHIFFHPCQRNPEGQVEG